MASYGPISERVVGSLPPTVVGLQGPEMLCPAPRLAVVARLVRGRCARVTRRSPPASGVCFSSVLRRRGGGWDADSPGSRRPNHNSFLYLKRVFFWRASDTVRPRPHQDLNRHRGGLKAGDSPNFGGLGGLTPYS
jgi:hypothetical protein